MRCSIVACCVAAWLAAAQACDLVPVESAQDKSPGDNFYRLLVNGEVERYQPEKRYVVTLVGSRTHDVVQQFTGFRLVAEPLDPRTPRGPAKQGQFQLFADTLSKFDEECSNSVVEADDLPKTEVQVMWRAPPRGSGCVLLKAMVIENGTRWFAEDGQLTKRVCEDSSLMASDCCACDDAKYKMTFQGLWSAQTHPRYFPTQAQWLTHFSDVIGATHTKNFSFWGEGQVATDGFRSLAEWGSVGLLERELRQKGPALRSLVKAAGLWHPRVTANTSAAFSVDRVRHVLSVASMFGPSPDWVVGVSGLDLCQADCTWVQSKVVDLYPYDAGTDSGISYMSPNAETIPREKMFRITNMYPEDPRAPFYDPAGGLAPLARLTLTREALLPKACDEEVLSAQLQQSAGNEDSGRPECDVTEWGAWSACSVTCGKGLRMRTREYRLPQKAAMSECSRQLVGKEMCVAAVPECETEQSNTFSDPTVLDASPPEDADGACRTSEWGPWSECSVTCGVGAAVRRRHFRDRMGAKKCPLVEIEESRKCMEPACVESDTETPDPACPTSAWSGWSPCSATCGRGVRFRTRLLLVPPEQQQGCQTKIELLQQRPCVERDDCSIDMMTAKRICMEDADVGPCRGFYQRWTFMAAKGMCVPFAYGGCRGNRNNFLTQDDCMNTCKVVLGALGATGTPPQVAASIGSNDLVSNVLAPTEGDAAAPSADCRVSAWSEWSRCSVSCGFGYQERVRSVLSPAGPGGAPCPSRMSRRRRCSRYC